MALSRLPSALFLSHGGGPCFFMTDGGRFKDMDKNSAIAQWYRSFSKAWPKPRAIVIISAHWEENGKVHVTSGAAPPLIYDYYGFPAHTYELKYPAPGDPVLATEIVGLLNGAGVAATADASRGFDHGVFVPLKLAYPDADVPVVQVSLLASMDPAAHAAIGAALAPLTAPERGILLVGSGQATHNLRSLDPSTPAGRTNPQEAAFLSWLGETVESGALTAAERRRGLDAWDKAPHARAAHPREEHLLPLHVVEAAVGYRPGRVLYDQMILGTLSLRSYEFPAATTAVEGAAAEPAVASK